MIVGLEMLFEQAAAQFEHWARVPFQRRAVAAAMLAHIAGLAEQAPHLRREAGGGGALP